MIHFDLNGKKDKIEELSKLTEEENFWKDQKKSKKIINEINSNKKIIESFNAISAKVSSMMDELTAEDLSYYNHSLEWVCEPGDFEIMTGPNSRDLQSVQLTVK